MLVSVHCYKCYGAGQVRVRNQIGMITYSMCTFCHGVGRRHVPYGGGEHRISANIAAVGLGPGIRKGHSAHIRNKK